MSRAVSVLAAALTTACFLVTGSPAQKVERAPDVIDGAGMVDFSGRPNFTVGSWTKYHTKGSSLQGHKDDYTVTILIAGEEVWWGEPCLWIETWTAKQGQRMVPTASLVSYTAFGDTMAFKHILWFMRKTIGGFTPDGKPDMVLFSRQASEFRLRKANWDEDDVQKVKVDTLGTDSVSVAAGAFTVTKVLKLQGHTETAERGDSTIFYERRHEQTVSLSKRVPITSIVKIETDDLQQGKSWLAGQFDQGPLKILERARGTTELIEYGTGGLTPMLVPEALRRPIVDRALVEHALSLPPEPVVKPLKRGGQ